jgi:hypothetical protein
MPLSFLFTFNSLRSFAPTWLAAGLVMLHAFGACCHVHSHEKCRCAHDHSAHEHIAHEHDFHGHSHHDDNDHTGYVEPSESCDAEPGHDNNGGTCCSECDGEHQYVVEMISFPGKSSANHLALVNAPFYFFQNPVSCYVRFNGMLPWNGPPPRLYLLVQRILL